MCIQFCAFSFSDQINDDDDDDDDDDNDNNFFDLKAFLQVPIDLQIKK